MENSIKWNNGDNSYEWYMNEDPAILSDEELREIGNFFNLDFETVKNIALGMTEQRRLVREQLEKENGA